VIIQVGGGGYFTSSPWLSGALKLEFQVDSFNFFSINYYQDHRVIAHGIEEIKAGHIRFTWKV
jgi:hypothetical protein